MKQLRSYYSSLLEHEVLPFTEAATRRFTMIHVLIVEEGSPEFVEQAIATELSLSLVRVPALNLHPGLTSALAAVAIRSISAGAPG